MTANAQQSRDPRVKDLMQAGRVRVALFLPQFTKNPVTGEIRGDVHLVETARALAARLGVELVLIDYPTPTKAVEGLKAGSCDVAFLGNDRSRAAEVSLSPPFVELDYTYLVPAGSSIRSVADVDRPEVRIAVIRNHASTLDSEPDTEARHTGVRRYPGPRLRSAADRTRGHMGISGLCTSAVFHSIARLTGA